MNYTVHGSPGQNTEVGSLSLLQGIFPTQGSNPDLLHCRQILYQLSYKGSLPSQQPHKIRTRYYFHFTEEEIGPKNNGSKVKQFEPKFV